MEVLHIRITGYIKNRNNSVGVYIANCRRNPLQLYFEVEIVALGRNSIIGVGLVHDKYPLDRLPGWKSGSIGFHADDGSIFIETGYGDPYGPVWNVGDMIGCGIHLPSETNSPKKSSKVDFFFTYNGKKLNTKKVKYPTTGFFPAIGMRSEGATVRLHLNAQSNEIVGIAIDETDQITKQMEVSQKDAFLDGSFFKATRKQNILTSALKNNIQENPTAPDAGWEYYELKRSYDTLQSVHSDKREENEQLFDF